MTTPTPVTPCALSADGKWIVGPGFGDSGSESESLTCAIPFVPGDIVGMWEQFMGSDNSGNPLYATMVVPVQNVTVPLLGQQVNNILALFGANNAPA